MSKKNLTKPPAKPQPTDEQIAEFVQGGPGNNTETQNTVNTANKESVNVEMARLTVDLPRSLHRRFKVACVLAGFKMNDEIRQFIDRRCPELESENNFK